MYTKTFKIFLQTFPRVAFFSYILELKRELSDCRTCLDVGCGGNSPIRLIELSHKVGVEGYKPSLDLAKQNKTHDEYLLCDILDIGKHFHSKQFDCVVALDVIEHLSKGDGYCLLKEMEEVASKKVVIFTPNGFLPQNSHDGDMQMHLSGWDVDEMEKLGYRVIGMHGLKSLRGIGYEHKIKPKYLGGIISEISHYIYSRKHPKKAAAILCVKIIS